VNQVKEMYSHAFGSYMKHAFPADELRPLSCDGRRIRERGDLDAVLGNYSMTLIDALDSLVIFDQLGDFERAVKYVGESVHFDLDVEVSTFEVNIRLLGGLVSGHLHASKVLSGYDGSLLAKAVDLANRLRPAFQTPTGMPVSRINLKLGKPQQVSSIVTIAEAGSFLLEFGVLSLLTGDVSFYTVARQSAVAFWSRRSSLGLVGTAADVNTGGFTDGQSTTGPGQDSFYEYLLKAYILFDDVELLEMFYTAYAAVEQYHSFEGFTYSVDMFKGLMTNTHLSPLSCVWGSLQVLVGDVVGGLRTVLYWYGLWMKHGALPEVYDTKTEAPTTARDSPLRPELVEALFYLSLALPGDPTVFRIARSIVSALDSQSRVECGFASVADVTTKRLDDRMDSFFLSETLVYLYLTIAPPEDLRWVLPWPLASSVFSTEGHLFSLPQVDLYKVSRMPGRQEHAQERFPALGSRPLLTCDALSPFEQVSVKHRCRTKYVMTAGYQLQSLAHAPMRCRQQEVAVLVDASSRNASRRGEQEPGTPMLLRGIASSLGPRVPALPLLAQRPGAVGEAEEECGRCGAESPVFLGAAEGTAALEEAHGPANQTVMPARASRPGVPERVFTAPLQDELGLLRLDLDRPPGQVPAFSFAPARHARSRELFARRRVVIADPLDACTPLVGEDGLGDAGRYAGKIAVISRGSCLFLHKLQTLQQAHVAGALVVNHAGEGQELQVMTCPLGERGAGRDVHIPAVMLSHEDGAALMELVRSHDREGSSVTACMFAEH